MTDKGDIKRIAKESGFYEPYSHFSRTLRAWLVAYGIGSVALFATQENLASKILSSGAGLKITVIFLAGVSFQILGSFLYKYSMGIIYFSELDPRVEKWQVFKIADWISESICLEFFLDAASILCFLYGTYLIMDITLAA